MTVHGIMKVWFDDHVDYDSEVLDPLYKDREEAAMMKAVTETKTGQRECKVGDNDQRTCECLLYYNSWGCLLAVYNRASIMEN